MTNNKQTTGAGRRGAPARFARIAPPAAAAPDTSGLGRPVPRNVPAGAGNAARAIALAAQYRGRSGNVKPLTDHIPRESKTAHAHEDRAHARKSNTAQINNPSTRTYRPCQYRTKNQ